VAESALASLMVAGNDDPAAMVNHTLRIHDSEMASPGIGHALISKHLADLSLLQENSGCKYLHPETVGQSRSDCHPLSRISIETDDDFRTRDA